MNTRELFMVSSSLGQSVGRLTKSGNIAVKYAPRVRGLRPMSTVQFPSDFGLERVKGVVQAIHKAAEAISRANSQAARVAGERLAAIKALRSLRPDCPVRFRALGRGADVDGSRITAMIEPDGSTGATVTAFISYDQRPGQFPCDEWLSDGAKTFSSVAAAEAYFYSQCYSDLRDTDDSREGLPQGLGL